MVTKSKKIVKRIYVFKTKFAVNMIIITLDKCNRLEFIQNRIQYLKKTTSSSTKVISLWMFFSFGISSTFSKNWSKVGLCPPPLKPIRKRVICLSSVFLLLKILYYNFGCCMYIYVQDNYDDISLSENEIATCRCREPGISRSIQRAQRDDFNIFVVDFRSSIII